MIATAFYDGQGLGNQLWVYAACRSIAEKLQMPHKILSPNKFKGNSFLDIDFGLKETAKNGSEKTKSALSVFHERIFYDQDLNYFFSDFDDAVLNLKPFTKIDGLFQSEDYFFGDLTLPKKYIKVKATHLEKKLVPDDCCIINLRGGEYKRHKNLILPKSYWHNAMRNICNLFGIDNFIVVTDDRRYAKALFPKLSVLQGGIAECYVALYQARYLILSNTSFSYFPVKTGIDKSFVIAPMHWSRFGNKYSRWASPANLYKGWMWQDAAGSLHSYTDCLQEVENTKEYYQNHYYISTVPSAVMNPGINGYIPIWLKKPIKKGLLLLFPKHIG
jgi:hypothetical protein